MSVILTTLLLLSSSMAFAQSVADRDPSAPVVVLNSGGSAFELYVEPNSGTNDSPHQAYVPIGTDGSSTGDGINNRNFSFYANRANLPLFVGEVPQQVTSLIFRLNVDVDLDNGNDVLVVAGGSGTSYEVIATTTQTADNGDLTYVLNFTDICGLTSFDCKSFEKDADTNARAKFNIYIFVSNNSVGDGDIVNPASSGTGAIYEINLSNRVYQNNIMEVFDLFKGDSQLTVDLRGFSMTNDRGLFGLVTPAGSGLCSGVSDTDTNDTLGGLSKTFSDLLDLESRVITGQVKIKNLSNDICQRVRVFNCDLYGFCSFASQEFQNTPENIQALLEKQACFFFTAGFGEQHPIVDYFQAWRDNTLRKFWLGRQFIQFYYRVAPQYTPFILERPWLQSLIRGVAYVLYGAIKWGWLILFLGVLGIGQNRFKKKLSN
jgi:hypothetical protein